MQKVDISIIVPCYNQGIYLDEALKSISLQSFYNWECIIVDDGSNDHTSEVAQYWKSIDDRFIYLYKENGGLASARNAGIMRARGRYILPLDADDKISKFYLEKAMKEFASNNDLSLVYGKAEFFDGKSGPWNLRNYSYRALLEENLIFCSCIYRKSNCLYDETMKQGLEDWDFLVRYLDEEAQVHCLNEVVFYYRVKPSSMIVNLHQNLSKVSAIERYILLKNNQRYLSVLGKYGYIKRYVSLISRIAYFRWFKPLFSSKQNQKNHF